MPTHPLPNPLSPLSSNPPIVAPPTPNVPTLPPLLPQFPELDFATCRDVLGGTGGDAAAAESLLAELAGRGAHGVGSSSGSGSDFGDIGGSSMPGLVGYPHDPHDPAAACGDDLGGGDTDTWLLPDFGADAFGGDGIAGLPAGAPLQPSASALHTPRVGVSPLPSGSRTPVGAHGAAAEAAGVAARLAPATAEEEDEHLARALQVGVAWCRRCKAHPWLQQRVACTVPAHAKRRWAGPLDMALGYAA